MNQEFPQEGACDPDDANAREEPEKSVDSKVFEILVRQYHRRLIAYAISLASRDDVAQDLVQDAFLVAYVNLSKFDASKDFGAWMRGIIRMKYLEWKRSQKEAPLEEETLDAIAARHGTWDRALEEGQEDALSALRTCVGELVGVSRRTLELFYFERKSCTDIAEALGTSEAAIRKRLERIRQALGNCVQERLGLHKRWSL